MIKELAILNELTTRLQTVTTGNGYYTNAGNSVSQGRAYYSASSELPVIAITPNENGDEVEARQTHSTKYKLANDFIIEGHIVTTSDLTEVYQLGRDIVRSVLGTDLRLDNRAIEVVYKNQIILPPNDGNNISVVRITVGVVYHEDLSLTGA